MWIDKDTAYHVHSLGGRSKEMGIAEEYDKLTLTEQESFQRIVNWLLAHTYLLQIQYDFGDNIKKTNRDYLFVERHFALLQEYLTYSGFQLEKDSNYGVISLTSKFDFNRQKFDKMATLMLYVLRLMYEEEREKLSRSTEVFVSTGEVIHKMISLGVIKKKPANAVVKDALRQLNHFQIIDKANGSWESADTMILILPTILFIVSNERISNMYRLLEEVEADDIIEEDL